MSLEKQGMVFIIRPSPDSQTKYLWLYPEFVQIGDIDCTGMNDDEFEKAISLNDRDKAQSRTPQSATD